MTLLRLIITVKCSTAQTLKGLERLSYYPEPQEKMTKKGVIKKIFAISVCHPLTSPLLCFLSSDTDSSVLCLFWPIESLVTSQQSHNCRKWTWLCLLWIKKRINVVRNSSLQFSVFCFIFRKPRFNKTLITSGCHLKLDRNQLLQSFGAMFV